MTTKLQHEDGSNIRADRVTVHYDGRIRNLEINEEGTVEAENQAEVNELLENHGKFFKLDEDEEADHVLDGKTVDEVAEYVSEIEDTRRLKELREYENRKTGKEAIDDRIGELQEEEKQIENQEGDEEDEEVNQDEVSEEDETEDGEEAEE